MVAKRGLRLSGGFATLVALSALGAAAVATAQTPSPPTATATAVSTPSPRAPAPATAPPNTPAVSPASGAASGATLDLTRADDGRTLHIAVGATVIVRLGAALDWTVNVAPAGVLQPMPGIGGLEREVQAVRRAVAPGTATVSAEGRPHCDPGQVCAQVRVSFLATLIVEPAGGATLPRTGAGSTDSDAAALFAAIAAVVVAGVASVAAVAAGSGPGADGA